MYSLTFDWKGIQVPVNDAVITYVGGVDPTLQWEARGLTAHNKDLYALERLNKEKKVPHTNLWV